DGAIDYDRLKTVVRLAVHFLDNVIDVSEYPIAEIANITRLNRKIGLGVMGWADLLILLGIAYDSDEAIGLGEEMMRIISREATEASIAMAAERGPFPRWMDESIYHLAGKAGSPGWRARRNATVTTVAPTGRGGGGGGGSSGIEPVYSIVYRRL